MAYKLFAQDKPLPEEDDELILKPWMKTVLFFAAALLILNFAAILYIINSKYIYFWDSATYWDISRKIASGAINEGGFWKNVYNSISELDYNYVAGVPSSFWVKLFGQSRLVYVLGLTNMYLFPSICVIYHISRKFTEKKMLTAIATIALCPVFVFLTLAGFVDIGGFLMALVCFDLYYGKKTNIGEWYKYVLIGILLVFMMIWRRWYSFFAVAFITAMIADCFLIKDRKWYMALITVLTFAATLLLGFRDFVIDKLMVDYGSLYQSYKFSLSTDLKLITRHFGVVLILALAAISVILGIKRKEKKHIFIWIQLIVSFSMFVSTQTHSQHHLLLYAPGICTLIIMLLGEIQLPKLRYGAAALAALTIINLFIPRTQPQNIQEIKHYALIPDFSMLPKHRDDTYQILEFKRKMDSLVGMGEKLGVLASSFDFNEDILRNAEPSLGIEQKRVQYIQTLPQVDSRDKDLSAIYNSNYIVVACPAQTHLAPGEQKTVECAVDSFNSWSDIAQSYKELYDYLTQINGITLKVFKRVRDIPASDKLIFENKLAQWQN